MEESKSKLFKQRLYRIHSSIGISLSLFMYISIFFGIFAIFLPYIQVWEKPSLHFERTINKNIDYEKILESVLSNPDYPKNNVYINLPGSSKDPTVRISHRFMERNYFNPQNSEKINSNENTQLARFLNAMHYGRPLKIIGYILFGLVCVGTMVLLVGGLILIIKLKFQKNGKNSQAKFSKWHRYIFIYTTPIFLLIVLTGALMNVGYLSSKPLTLTVTNGQSNNIKAVTSPILRPKVETPKPLNEQASMLPIADLINKAKHINPDANFQRIKLIHWKDKNAQVEFIGYNPYKPFINGVYNKEKILLSAVDGSLIKDHRAEDATWSVIFADAFYFIHLLNEVDIFTRLFVALLMFGTSLGIGFGVMLWLEKRAKLFGDEIPFYHWVGRLSLSVMIGVVPATAMLFVSQWLLPFTMENRIFIQQAIFFNFWLVTLFWSFYRLNSYKIAKEFLYLGGILFILSSILHFYKTGFSPITLIENGMINIFSVDMGLTVLGILLIFVAKKLPNKRSGAKLFWNNKYKGSK